MMDDFDPRVRPVAARTRAKKRRVAAVGERPEFVDIMTDPPARSDVQAVAALLPDTNQEALVETLFELAESYAGWRNQPAETESEITTQLKMVAHLVWKIDQAKDVAATEHELEVLLSDLTDGARDSLVIALGRPWTPFIAITKSTLSDWETLGAAAITALQRRPKKRDYYDHHLSAAIDQLIGIYLSNGGKRMTWSNRSSGPSTSAGNQRQVAGSPLGKFVSAFVELVAPDIRPTAAHNMLRDHLRKRKLVP